jgi:hypothetical protein
MCKNSVNLASSSFISSFLCLPARSGSLIVHATLGSIERSPNKAITSPLNRLYAVASVRGHASARLSETRVPTVQVDPMTVRSFCRCSFDEWYLFSTVVSYCPFASIQKKQPTLNMIELFANDSGEFIKGYCDRMVTKAELASETGISLRDLRSITESSQRRRRIATLISRPNAMIFHMDVRFCPNSKLHWPLLISLFVAYTSCHPVRQSETV